MSSGTNPATTSSSILSYTQRSRTSRSYFSITEPTDFQTCPPPITITANETSTITITLDQFTGIPPMTLATSSMSDFVNPTASSRSSTYSRPCSDYLPTGFVASRACGCLGFSADLSVGFSAGVSTITGTTTTIAQTISTSIASSNPTLSLSCKCLTKL